MSKFKVGDIVKHKASFLKNIGWITNVPVDGKVVRVEKPDAYSVDCVQVHWSDGSWSSPIREEHILLASEPDTSGM